ncbi:hypothetical protein N0V85_009425, partial [Neurospora sp. IMI 360204]
STAQPETFSQVIKDPAVQAQLEEEMDDTLVEDIYGEDIAMATGEKINNEEEEEDGDEEDEEELLPNERTAKPPVTPAPKKLEWRVPPT